MRLKRRLQNGGYFVRGRWAAVALLRQFVFAPLNFAISHDNGWFGQVSYCSNSLKDRIVYTQCHAIDFFNGFARTIFACVRKLLKLPWKDWTL